MEKTWQAKLTELRQLCDVASSKGNFDANSYLHGMANGMLFALSVMEGTEPEYLDPPSIFLDELDLLDQLSKYGVEFKTD